MAWVERPIAAAPKLVYPARAWTGRPGFRRGEGVLCAHPPCCIRTPARRHCARGGRFCRSVLPVTGSPASPRRRRRRLNPDAAWPANNTGFANQVVALVNQHRAALGLVQLKVSPTLTASAVWKARHMAYYSYMQHDDPAPPVSRLGTSACRRAATRAGEWARTSPTATRPRRTS